MKSRKEVPIVECEVKLEKFQGKGGWTYAPVPAILHGKSNSFGWIRVKGNIDDFYFEQYHLMPMGNGNLFLPVKAEVRKKIGKTAGDTVKVILFKDDNELLISKEFEDCLKDEPGAFGFFNQLKHWEKKMIINNINSAKQEKTRIERIAKMINELAKGKHPFQQNKPDL